ncbi:acetyl-CoA synthetase, partial [Roseobacter denitrificans OCh 114]
MSDTKNTPKSYPPSADMVANAHVTLSQYASLYSESVSDSEGFWRREGGRVDW